MGKSHSRKARKGKGNSEHSRKRNRSCNCMSVEQLHASFKQMDQKIRRAIEQGSTDSSLSNCIQTLWSEQFQHDLPVSFNRDLVSHYRAVTKGTKAGRMTRKQKRSYGKHAKKQKGGLAPLHSTLGQGTTAYTYGSFPVEIGSSSSAVKALNLNRFYENPVGRECDTTGGAPAPIHRGGGLFNAMTMPHAPASIPHNMMETSLSTIQGAPIQNPVASPMHPTWQLATYTPQAYNSSSVSSISNIKSVASGPVK